MMNRDEFLDRLEYLLQDISDDEKREALDYYRDYLEDAGPENEQTVLEGFGSPEQVASMIRIDLMGGMEQAGEFTDRGFTDERFKRTELPARAAARPRPEREIPKYDRTASGRRSVNSGDKGFGFDKWLKVLLIIVLLFLVSPVIMVTGAAFFSGALGLLSVLLAIFVVLAVLTFCGFLLGALFLFIGLACLFVEPWLGLALLGVGLISLGIGFLLFICDYLFYGKFLPWCVMGIVNILGGLLHRAQRRQDQRYQDPRNQKQRDQEQRFQEPGERSGSLGESYSGSGKEQSDEKMG